MSGVSALLKVKAQANAFGFHRFKVLVNPEFVNGAQSAGGYFQGYPLVGFRNEKPFFLQVGQKAALRLAV